MAEREPPQIPENHELQHPLDVQEESDMGYTTKGLQQAEREIIQLQLHGLLSDDAANQILKKLEAQKPQTERRELQKQLRGRRAFLIGIGGTVGVALTLGVEHVVLPRVLSQKTSATTSEGAGVSKDDVVTSTGQNEIEKPIEVQPKPVEQYPVELVDQRFSQKMVTESGTMLSREGWFVRYEKHDPSVGYILDGPINQIHENSEIKLHKPLLPDSNTGIYIRIDESLGKRMMELMVETSGGRSYYFIQDPSTIDNPANQKDGIDRRYLVFGKYISGNQTGETRYIQITIADGLTDEFLVRYFKRVQSSQQNR